MMDSQMGSYLRWDHCKLALLTQDDTILSQKDKELVGCFYVGWLVCCVYCVQSVLCPECVALCTVLHFRLCDGSLRMKFLQL
jgi:hypothetical protein